MNRKRWLLVAVIAALLAVLLYATVGRSRDGGGQRGAAGPAGPAAGPTGAAPLRVDRHDPRRDATARVGGTVRDLRGAGVPGAWVCASVWRNRDLSDDDTREPRCTTSDPAGAWRLDALWPARWAIGAGAPKLRPAEWEDPATRTGGVRLAAGEDRGGIDLVLEDGGVLAEGTVLDLTGGTIAAAFVTVSSAGWRGGGAACRTRSGDDGRFACWVAPGRVWVTGNADGYAAGWTDGIAPGMNLEVLLTPESALGGVVVAAGTDTPIAGARVELEGDWGTHGQVFSDDAGRFRFSRMAPGRYKAVATAPGRYGEAAESVLLGLAQSRDDLRIEVHPASEVTGTVAVAGPDDEPGEPAAECEVSLSRSDGRDYDDTTEADGRVRFEAVQPGTYQVSIDCEHQVGRVPYPELVVADAPIAAAWLVDGGAVLRGVVVDEHGAPIAHAGVRARNVGGDPRAARGGGSDDTDRDGRFVIEGLRAGAIEVDAGADGYPDPVEPIRTELPAAGTEVRVVLAGGGTIAGVVVDDTGAPLRRVEVSARGERGGDGTDVRDDGTFALPGLRAGDYRVRASRDGEPLRRPGSSDDDLQGARVAVSAGETTTIRLVVEASSGTITGRVVDASGAPVTDAYVRAERESEAAGRQRGGALRGARWSWAARPAVTDLDGRFTVEQLAPGRYTVLAYRKGGSEASAEGVALGSEVVLTVSPTASLSGTVETGGAAPRELQISVADPDTGVWRSESFFGSDGAWSVRDLPAGRYDVTAKAVEGTVSIEDVALTEGQQRTGVTLTLRGTVEVTGRVVDGETGAPVTGMTVMAMPIEGADGFSWRTGGGTEHISDAAGRFTVRDVAQGRVRLMARPRDRDSAYGRGVRVADATGTGTVDVGDVPVLKRRLPRGSRAGDLGFTLVELPPDTDPADVELKVANVRPDGPAARSGLVASDVIVAVDGRDCRGEQSWQYQATVAAPEGTTLRFGLARGDTVTVTLGRPE